MTEPGQLDRRPETKLPMYIAGLDKVFPQAEAQLRFREAATERASSFVQEADVYLAEQHQASIVSTDAFVTYVKSRPDVRATLDRTKTQFTEGAEPLVLSADLAKFYGVAAAVNECVQGKLATLERRPPVPGGIESLSVRLAPILDSKIMGLIKVQEWRVAVHEGMLGTRLGEAGGNLQRELGLRGGVNNYATADLNRARALGDFTSRKIADQRTALVRHVENVVTQWFDQIKREYPQPDATTLSKLKTVYNEVIRPLSDQTISLSSKLTDELKRFIFPEDYKP